MYEIIKLTTAAELRSSFDKNALLIPIHGKNVKIHVVKAVKV